MKIEPFTLTKSQNSAIRNQIARFMSLSAEAVVNAKAETDMSDFYTRVRHEVSSKELKDKTYVLSANCLEKAIKYYKDERIYSSVIFILWDFTLKEVNEVNFDSIGSFCSSIDQAGKDRVYNEVESICGYSNIGSGEYFRQLAKVLNVDLMKV